MDLKARISILTLLGMLAFLGFYLYGLVLGVFSPGELIGFTIMAVVFAALYLFHARRARQALRSGDDPAHETIARSEAEQREKRGF
jgi:mannose/fructose/N-acetylgalactosamine-specific phosphotransferase system component IIC